MYRTDPFPGPTTRQADQAGHPTDTNVWGQEQSKFTIRIIQYYVTAVGSSGILLQQSRRPNDFYSIQTIHNPS
ncbi:hypothetical protein [Fibrisoma montanum]|uniref:hypothetical protein n=1 Tax=Fibrisoma montanum TaxID=2305895 RepID=UPI0011C22EE5|nr:hypothetical protein [Fibrisoma montanum]